VTRPKLQGWSAESRVVVGRRLIPKKSPEESMSLFGESHYEYYAWVIDLLSSPFDALQIVEMYQGGADCENVFDALKNYGLGNCAAVGNSEPIRKLASFFLIQ
jgi:hypothetical protein